MKLLVKKATTFVKETFGSKLSNETSFRLLDFIAMNDALVVPSIINHQLLVE